MAKALCTLAHLNTAELEAELELEESSNVMKMTQQ